MFNSISWQTYLTILVSFIGAYYGITALILYYREIIQLVKQGRSRHTSEGLNQERSIDSNEVEIIGSSSPASTQRQEHHVAVDSDEFLISSSIENDSETIRPHNSNEPAANIIIGSVSDLLNELKTLIQLCTEYKSAKEECASLIAASFLKYPHLKGTTYQHAISAYVCEESKDHLPFTLTLSEVQQWWS